MKDFRMIIRRPVHGPRIGDYEVVDASGPWSSDG